jgi:hypothetical protein
MSMDAASAGRGRVFPIVEAFGYAADAASPAARKAKADTWCRFAGTVCEKYRQYGYGYCSVSYAAVDDAAIARVYAVCDHRLDGEPVRAALRDHFGSRHEAVTLVPEVVLPDPRTSFDYAAFTTRDNDIDDLIVIETQAIDIRGGGVGPAWRAWFEGRPERWREYFTDEARAKGRRDTVAYGVNMANIYKRLGLQVAVKGSYLKALAVPFYVLMQDRPFQYLARRVPFRHAEQDWDVTFMTFDYTGVRGGDGTLEFAPVQTIRVTLLDYVEALTTDTRISADERERFLASIKRKAGMTSH